MKTLSGKVVAITGAGSGIGRALALQAARAGARLALADWKRDAVEETARLAGAPCLVREVDVRDDGAVSAFAADVARELGGADAVVNNAGVSLAATVGRMKREDFQWLFEINFWGVVRGTEAFLPQLREKPDAHLVNLSSIFGIIAVPGQAAYNAAKFAVRGYTEALRQELHGSSVHVTCVHPGGVRTNIARNGRMLETSRGETVQEGELERSFDAVAKLSPEKAAAIIWRAVARDAPRVLVGWDAFWIDKLQRLLPVGYPALVRSIRARSEKRGLRF